ncbi:DUF2202 domain-containing protein [Demequina sp. SYSU T00192]|uniref:DUF2202 domain-containing protein n=1 Tax=Demequina litoralis TaxID=3051660 RepID=A0ABT8GAN7_9MICO|nr:DUF2202 domain-containing protein [Demequina sp. SYSU T00192]MDN4476034.1 DUF2202 domain-containing protein [Demequina sp. SYSU T00192]
MNTRTTRVALTAAAGAALLAVPVAAWAGSGGGDDDASGSGNQARIETGMGMMGGWGHADDDDDDGYGRGGMGMMGGRGAGDGRGYGDGSCLDDAVDGEATDADAASLAAMADEERMARDLYTELADAWDLRLLDAIAGAEDRHLDAVVRLAEAYGLEEPSAGAEAGVYADADLQDLYDELLAQGSESETAALGVGALVEETDIADLRDQDVDSDAIAGLYARLEHASGHHLTAFVRALDASDAPYEASVLDPAEVEDITGVPAP